MNHMQRQVLEPLLKGERGDAPMTGGLTQCYKLGYITEASWDAEITDAGYVEALRWGLWTYQIPLRLEKDGGIWSAQSEIKGIKGDARRTQAMGAAVAAFKRGELELRTVSMPVSGELWLIPKTSA